ncbi:permease-like cell division protein FtsX [Streptosporangium soli]|nr:permease-like cell division protein FtsX [Streptosporangium sp. KLBMP 9127]
MRIRWIVSGVLALMTAGGGAMAWAIMQGGPSAPPDGPWPTDGWVWVAMCGEDDPQPRCSGRGPATGPEERSVIATLSGLPGISGVEPSGASAIVKAAMRDRERFPQVKAALEGKPGVAGVTGVPKGFWQGKSDVGVLLCTAHGCDGRGAATEPEKDAIYEWLRAQPEVAEVYFADRAHAVRTAEHDVRGGLLNGKPDPDPAESFHVKLLRPDRSAAIERIRLAVKNLPGVHWAGYGQP